ncbi:IS66 family insertion sequence element accessory protein TnpB [Lawsonibacter sp. LCP25S3_G6]|uniref:IS66 family insertion sequence element accessory protein TnpB n=1 Tax=unclassified Lawsonibacter TaxID=2617946 RepID=UPI003F9A33E2
MLNDFNCSCPVYIACGYTDLRRGIDGLATVVKSQLQMGPFLRALFLFCGRRRGRFKALYWEGDGFLLLYCILSSKNPWFCQSKFLGIATGIPWFCHAILPA